MKNSRTYGPMRLLKHIFVSLNMGVSEFQKIRVDSSIVGKTHRQIISLHLTLLL